MLSSLISALTDDEADAVREEIIAFLGIDRFELQRGILRVMIERVRPFALPHVIWARPTDSINDISSATCEHLEYLGFEVTTQRLRAMHAMYMRFAGHHRDAHISEELLVQQDFRCTVCGLAWHNEELEDIGVVSPFKYRSRPKVDKLKPHWRKPGARIPRLDHQWSIRLYGGNDDFNINAICDCCNLGKAQYMSVVQTRPYTGLPDRDGLSGSTHPMTPELFYTQMRRAPMCSITGRSAKDVELTVQLRDANFPIVLDNLVTVESP